MIEMPVEGDDLGHGMEILKLFFGERFAACKSSDGVGSKLDTQKPHFVEEFDWEKARAGWRHYNIIKIFAPESRYVVPVSVVVLGLIFILGLDRIVHGFVLRVVLRVVLSFFLVLGFGLRGTIRGFLELEMKILDSLLVGEKIADIPFAHDEFGSSVVRKIPREVVFFTMVDEDCGGFFPTILSDDVEGDLGDN